jgi:hypothetical protein
MREPLFLLGLLATLLAAPSFAQEQDPSSLCQLNASLEAITREVSNDVFLTEVSTKCRHGDIISFPASRIYVINKVCDFSKSIVAFGRDLSCVYLGRLRADRPRS